MTGNRQLKKWPMAKFIAQELGQWSFQINVALWMAAWQYSWFSHSCLNAARVQVYKSGGLLVFRFASSTLTSLQSQQAYVASRDGTVARVLTPRQCVLGSIPARCHLWVEFVVVSRLALRVYLRTCSPSSTKHLQITITIRPRKRTRMKISQGLCGLLYNLLLFWFFLGITVHKPADQQGCKVFGFQICRSKSGKTFFDWRSATCARHVKYSDTVN